MAKRKSKKRINLKRLANKKVIRVAAIVLAVLIVFSVAAYKLSNYSPLGVGKGISNLGDSMLGNNGFPYSISSNDVKHLGMSGSDLVVLNDTGVKIIDSSGRQVSDFQHNYSSPLIYTYGSHSLVLDAGKNLFRVQTSGKIIYEQESQFELLTGDISKNGCVAIATKSDQGASMLSVFDSKKNEIFSWVCAKHMIVSVDISDNGRYIAAGVIGADSGDIVSEVYLFDKNYSDAVRHFELPGTAVAAVNILSGKKLVIIGDNLVTFVNEKGERNDIDVSLNTVSRFFISDNNITSVVLSKYSSAYSNILKVYSASGKEISSADIDFQIKDMYSDGKHIALLSDSKIVCYDLYGRVSGEKSIDNDSVKCCLNGSNVYVLFSNAIKQYSVRGNSDERVTRGAVEKIDEEVVGN
ncbi:MAG: DUF5711 family protein [Clostridiales bacterium]|nr:DUF5711 family protein [Clostridiales bacterium]